MTRTKRILIIALAVLSLIVLNGVYYVFCGQEKSMKKLDEGRALNVYECCSIYTMHLAATTLGVFLSPEAAEQCLLMMFVKEDSFHPRRRDFMKSEYIRQQALENHFNRFVVNFPLNEITSDKGSALRGELRYALAYDGAVFDDEGCVNKLWLDVKYDGYTARYNVGPFDVVFHWQLLKYIQDKGWLHKFKMGYLS
jgi:hypothetical protein